MVQEFQLSFIDLSLNVNKYNEINHVKMIYFKDFEQIFNMSFVYLCLYLRR